MTREEAIKRFEALLLHVDTDCVMGMETTEAINMAISVLKAQNGTDTNVGSNDLISRQAAIDRAVSIPMFGRDVKMVAVSEIKNLPSAQPEPHYDEWCTDCKEYDHERHCCPRWNKVIRQTVEDLKSADRQWIPCSERLPEYGVAVLTYDGSCYCVEKRIPTIRDDNGEPISSEWWVSDDYDENNSEYYPNLRDGACIAWMPLPDPYKERRTE